MPETTTTTQNDAITRINQQLARAEATTSALLDQIDMDTLNSHQRLTHAIKFMEHQLRLLRMRQIYEQGESPAHERDTLAAIMRSMRGETDE